MTKLGALGSWGTMMTPSGKLGIRLDMWDTIMIPSSRHRQGAGCASPFPLGLESADHNHLV